MIDTVSREQRRAALKQKQALPLKAKIILAKERIKEWYEYWDECGEGVYVSFSGGKDSTVLAHLVKSMYPDVPLVYSDTGLEYPEIKKFAVSMADEVVKPKYNFKEILRKYGYPIVNKETASSIEEARRNIPKGIETVRVKQLRGTLLQDSGQPSWFNKKKWEYLIDTDFRISDKCCYHMKKSPLKKYEKNSGNHPYIGLMAAESKARTQTYLNYGCNVFEGNHKSSKPLSIWTEQDVLEYIVEFNVPYCKEVYGKIIKKDGKWTTTGADRTGCLWCPLGSHLEKDENRFQRLARTHPQIYDYCIGGGQYDESGMWIPSSDGLGLGHVLDVYGVDYRVKKGDDRDENISK